MPDERRILLTGFEPWADHPANPAQQLAEWFAGWRQGETRVVGLVLPVARRAAAATVEAALRDLRPSAVLHLGLAAGRAGLTVECWAHNRADFRIPDHAGDQPRDEPLSEAGPARLATTLPVAPAVAALQRAGVPAAPSASAGTFVCNALLYSTLAWAAARGYAGPIGFVHLPAPATVALADQARALEHLLRLLAARPALPRALRRPPGAFAPAEARSARDAWRASRLPYPAVSAPLAFSGGPAGWSIPPAARLG